METGKKIFETCCNNLGINFEEVFCYGKGNTFSVDGNIQRYVFQTTKTQLKPKHKYVVKYFAKEEMYLCWSREHKEKRTKFSATRRSVLEALEFTQLSFEKGVEFRNGTQEKVYAFKKENVIDFLKYLQENFL